MYKLLTEYTREEFLAMENFGDDAEFTGIIIVPTDELHEHSGYRMMKFILTRRWDIVGVISGWSESVFVNGFRGLGKYWEKTLETDMMPRVGWTIDCLPTSGCVRLFADKTCKVEYVGNCFSFYVEESDERS